MVASQKSLCSVLEIYISGWLKIQINIKTLISLLIIWKIYDLKVQCKFRVDQSNRFGEFLLTNSKTAFQKKGI